MLVIVALSGYLLSYLVHSQALFWLLMLNGFCRSSTFRLIVFFCFEAVKLCLPHAFQR